MSHYLFAYGTLNEADVQQYVFQRVLNGTPDTLSGYLIAAKKMYGRYLVLEASGDPSDEINGVAYVLSLGELLKADIYEGPEYTRIQVLLKSGTTAWVYVEKNGPMQVEQ